VLRCSGAAVQVLKVLKVLEVLEVLACAVLY
jgi:hypothetical protein